MKGPIYAIFTSAFLALAPSAMAQGSSVETYGGQGTEVAGLESGGASPATEGGAGSLPFTGLDLALLVGGGLVLLLIGLTLARSVRREQA